MTKTSSLQIWQVSVSANFCWLNQRLWILITYCPGGMNWKGAKYLNKSVRRRADSQAYRSRAVPAVRTVTVSSRAGAGLFSETVQQGGYSLSYLPDGLAWCDISQSRLPFLHLLHCTPPFYRKINTFSPTRQREHGGGESNPCLVTKMLQQCNIRKAVGVPPSHGYQCCLTCSTAGNTDMAAPLLFPYAWDTVQQMHKSSLAIYFCSAYHVENLITTSINDSWARDVPFAHMEPIASANSFLRLRKLFDVYMRTLLVGTKSRQILLPARHHHRSRWTQLWQEWKQMGGSEVGLRKSRNNRRLRVLAAGSGYVAAFVLTKVVGEHFMEN